MDRSTAPLRRDTLDVDGTPILVEGPDDPRAPVVLMLHGWPDTLRLWDRQAAALRDRVRCVRYTQPGFDPAGPRVAPGFDALATLAGRVADAVSPGRPVRLLLHDWGCAIGYAWASAAPGRVERIVGVDVGDAGSPAHRRALGLRGLAGVTGYQVWLAAAWAIGGRVGDAMTRRLARAIRAPADASTLRASIDWPYGHVWTGRGGETLRRASAFEPACPMLYVYGRRKPFMFHSPDWLARLEASPHHRVLGLRTGHWAMRDAPEAFDAAVLPWLADERAPDDAPERGRGPAG